MSWTLRPSHAASAICRAAQRWLGQVTRRLRPQGGDRGQQLAAMADRGYAHADQVVGRQLGQHFAIDIVVAECSRVLFEPQPAQPRRYVHVVILGSEERQRLMDEDIPLPFELPAAALKYSGVGASGCK